MTNVQVVTAAPPLAEKETTIHGQRSAGDEGGIIRTGEDHRVGDYVESNECTVTTGGANHIERWASLFLTPSGNNDRRSLFTKRDGRGATDARRGAGHKGNLPSKVSHIIDPFSASRRSTVSITLRT